MAATDSKYPRPSTSQRRARRRPHVYFAYTAVALIVLGLGAIVAISWLRSREGPCDSVFMHAGDRLALEVIALGQYEAKLSLGAVQLQDLGEQAQIVNAQLRACCTLRMADKLSEADFVQCTQYGARTDQITRDLAELNARLVNGVAVAIASSGNAIAQAAAATAAVAED